MRICLYTGTALPKVGGQELAVDALARHFVAMGHEVVVLAPLPRRSVPADDASLAYRVVRHPRFLSSRYFVGWYRWWLLRLYRAYEFQVLHCHGIYPPGYLAALCRARLRVPFAITSHGGDVREGGRRLTDPTLRRRHEQALEAADAVIAISSFTREGFNRLCPRPRRIVTIPNGVDLDGFVAPAPRPVGLKPAIRPREYALFLGRLHRRKGVDLLLHALALIPPARRFHLVIAGDGPDRPALEREAARLGLGEWVQFVGWSTGSSKIYLLQNALCVVVPSRLWEAFPLVVLEGYAAGRPVIATDLPALRDLIQPGHTGLLVPPESPIDLAHVLTQVFGDRLKTETLGKQGSRVALGFHWRNIAEHHLQLYEELRGSGVAAKVQ